MSKKDCFVAYCLLNFVESKDNLTTLSRALVICRKLLLNHFWGEDLMTVQEAMRILGITRNYRGYLRAVTAIELALEKEDRLDAVIEDIYLEVAKRRGCSWSAVERSIRTVIADVTIKATADSVTGQAYGIYGKSVSILENASVNIISNTPKRTSGSLCHGIYA